MESLDFWGVVMYILHRRDVFANPLRHVLHCESVNNQKCILMHEYILAGMISRMLKPLLP